MTNETFKYLYDQFFDPLRAYIYYRSGDEGLATDICQDVFLTLWKKQPDLPIEKLKALLYKMAKDRHVDLVRRRKVGQSYLETLSLKWENDDPEAQLELHELKINYEKALTRLPDNQRSVFLMSRIDGLTYREIAERLDLSVKAIEKRMNLALNTLRTQLAYGR